MRLIFLQDQSARLAVVSNDLAKRLNNPSLIPQQSSYDDIRESVYRPPSIDALLTWSNRIEQQLAGWSKWGPVRRFSKFRLSSRPP